MAADRTGIKWSREETILAFDLYCRTPFGKISQGNPEIIKLAHLLGRTPGSVGLKMHNLAHYDPELQKRSLLLENMLKDLKTESLFILKVQMQSLSPN